jgi:hypothetical protein
LKPVLLGMNNPYSERPDRALAPLPVNSAGGRIHKMLRARTGATKSQYMRAFERRNLLDRVEWCAVEAAARAQDLVTDLQGREVVVFGWVVAEALGLPKDVIIHPFEHRGVLWRRVPHPSGRNLWYNKRENTAMVELLLEELYVRSRAS